MSEEALLSAAAPAGLTPADEHRRAQPPAPGSRNARGRDAIQLLVLGAIVAGAGALRLAHLTGVPLDPYYDSAVRSMGTSLHDFLFGALEPGGTVSLDKPPLDLWPAVLMTKVFGFSALTARLPQALAGSATCGFLFLALRRAFGARAALLAAAAYALAPIAVITARSDTTDAIMASLCALALAMVARAIERDRLRYLAAAAILLALAFNVKLSESFPALPPLALAAYLGLAPTRPRLRIIAATGCLYVAAALSWLTFTLIVPAHDQPYAVGSTNGSPWNAAFVFNTIDRLKGVQTIEGAPGVYDPHRHYPQATVAERAAIPIAPPSAGRLLSRIGPLSGERLGLEVLVAALLGVPIALAALARGAPRDRRERVRRALLAALALWLAEGAVLFSAMARLHPRYTEAFTPAVAALLGIGVAAIGARPARSGVGRWGRLALLGGALAILLPYAHHLLYGTTALFVVVLCLGLAALALSLLAALLADRPLAGGLAALSSLALAIGVLAIPLSASLQAVSENASDGNILGSLPATELAHLSAYLERHQGSARFETAYDSATQMGALVLADGRPVLPLTTDEGHVIVSAGKLARLAAAGSVRYAVLSGPCPKPTETTNGDCSAPVRWLRAHGRDVSAAAGVPPGTIYELPAVSPSRPRQR